MPPAMAAGGTILTIKEVLEHPAVQSSGQIELSICDVLHFRIIDPKGLFRMVSLLAKESAPEIPQEYALWRMEAERSRRGSLLAERIDACCCQHPQLLQFRPLLLEKEMEVWSRLSYPNPWALRFCKAVLEAGKSISIPPLGLFPEDFHLKLLRQNGFMQPIGTHTQDGALRIHIGEQAFLPENHLHLVTERRVARSHPLGAANSLGCQLANGILERNLDELAAMERDESESRYWMLGFRLLGPAFAYLLQEAGQHELDVVYQGMGSDFLNNLQAGAARRWPWMKGSNPHQTDRFAGRATRASIFADDGGDLCLFSNRPSSKAGKGRALMNFPPGVPEDLVFRPLQMLFAVAFGDEYAPLIQAGAEAFVDEYTYMAMHRQIQLEVEPIIAHLVRFFLAPSAEWLDWLSRGEALRKVLTHLNPWTHKKLVEKGPWPTASYMLGGPLKQRWMDAQLPARTQQIKEALESWG